jgi:hypothetical protein
MPSIAASQQVGSMKKLNWIAFFVLQFLTTATVAQQSIFEEMGRRDYYEWHRIMCKTQSEFYGKYLVWSSKTLNEIVSTTTPNSSERRNQIEQYKSTVRQYIENHRKINYDRTTSQDQSDRIWGKWSNALYVTALTYSLENAGEILEYEAREILLKECMGGASTNR